MLHNMKLHFFATWTAIIYIKELYDWGIHNNRKKSAYYACLIMLWSQSYTFISSQISSGAFKQQACDVKL